jgi:WD40 repeat protein
LLSEVRAHKGPAADLAFTPDGRQIVTGGLDGRIAVWTYSAGAGALKHFPNVQVERDVNGFDLTVGASTGVATVDFSPDGTLLAVGGDSGTVLIKRFPSVELVRVLRGHTQSLQRAAFSRDGTRLVTASLDGSARIWDVATGRPLHVLRGRYSRGVLAASFSPDGRLVAVGARDHLVDVWNASTGERVASIPEQPGGMWAVVFDPKAQWLATGGYDGAIQLWELGALRR